MRTRIAVALVATVGLVALAAGPASAALDKSVSSSTLKTLENNLNKAKKLKYEAVYKSVESGQTTTVTIAQAPPKSDFMSTGSQIVNTGKTTYFCSSSSGSSPNCISETGANPLLGLESLFSPAVAEAAFTEAKEGLISRALGIKVSASSATFAGQSATCVSVTAQGKAGKYCVTKQGILAYAGTSSGYFELTKFVASPPASLFQLPAGATTVTIPGGGTLPGGASIP